MTVPPTVGQRNWAPSLLSYIDGALGVPSGALNVVNYGAVGDGVADDTVSIQAAITAASAAGGGTVFFPRGNYYLSASLSLPSYVTLAGCAAPFRATEYGIDPASVASTLLLGGSKNFPLVTSADHSGGNVSLGLRDLRFNCNTGTGLANVSIIDWNKVRRSRITGCYAEGNNNAGRVGLSVSNGSELLLVDWCTFEGAGVSVDTSNAVTLRSLEIANAGVSLSGSLGSSGFYNVVQDCQIYQTGISYPFPWVYGLVMADVAETVVDGCSVADTLEHGIFSPRGFLNGIITNNVVKNSGRRTTNTWSGISVDADTVSAHASTDYQIVGNRCFDLQGSPTQAYGISLTNTGGGGSQNTRALVALNNVHGNVNSGVSDTSSGSNTLASNVS